MLKKSIFALMILPALFSCKSKIGVIQQQSQKEQKSEQTDLEKQTEEKIITGTVLKEPLIIEVYPILNGIERVFIELSNYKDLEEIDFVCPFS